MKPTFLKYDKPILTAMLQADNPKRVEKLMEMARLGGAEAFGMQFCRMKEEYRTEEIYRHLMSLAAPYPTYVTNYRQGYNEGRDDSELAQGLLTLARCGATLCDVMGDMFGRQPDEMAKDSGAIAKQMQLIDELHALGAEVIMSSHVCKFTPAERVLEIALEQQRRGADICKIVLGASSMAEQIENLRIIDMLKSKLEIPFLILSSGNCRILRRIGGELGCCMYLCVAEHDEFSTATQPLLKDVKKIRDILSEENK